MFEIGGELKALRELAREAAQQRKQRLNTAHLLVAMLQREPHGGMLSSMGVSESSLLNALKNVNEEPGTAIDLSFERAVRLAHSQGEHAPRPYHLLEALKREPRSAAYACLVRCGVALGEKPSVKKPSASTQQLTWSQTFRDHGSASAATTQQPLTRTPLGPATPARPLIPLPGSRRSSPPGTPQRSSSIAPATTTAVAQPAMQAPAEMFSAQLDPAEFPVLCSLGRNLTLLAQQGKLDAVYGREREIERILDVLARRQANHPLLVGATGVGKTALVEGLAQHVHKQKPHGLADAIIIEVSSGVLVSGTGIRGALAEKLQKLRAEVARTQGRALLFFDDVHTMLGGGDGPDDLVAELKSALSRGELPCIAATSETDYRRHIEKDAGLVRRFSRVDVAEPSTAEAITIVKRASMRFEKHHAVAYTPDALERAVHLSVRFLPSRQLPEKAFEIIDLAAARARRRSESIVDDAAIAHVVSELAHVPVERLLMRDAERLLELERHICARVVGHEENIAKISEALRRSAAGFRGGRPLGTFLLLGSTGVGKTETAKAISEVLFGTEDFTRLDMSELSESHSVARMIGAPPGYVGHDDGGQLTEAVRRRPYQLVLLDEIEKAHPDVLLALLPLLDEGRLTDGRGRTIDFRNTVIVMTSNLGAKAAQTASPIGFGSASTTSNDASDAHVASARKSLAPELWNRIDETLWFAPLTRDNVREIAERMLKKSADQLRAEHAITLRWDATVPETLVDLGGFEATLGARPMRRTIARHVEALLAKAVLGSALGRGSEACLTVQDGEIALKSNSYAFAN